VIARDAEAISIPISSTRLPDVVLRRAVFLADLVELAASGKRLA